MKNTRIIELKTVDSTNLYAEELLKKGKTSDGLIILAHEQTAGKGQGINKWESEPGKNLTFSIILHTEWLAADQQFRLNKAITLGIMDFLGSLIDPAELSIKWPNDIFWRNRKMGGILINHIIHGAELTASIAGIGLNINQVSFSPSVPNPVSLKMIISRDTDTNHAFQLLIKSLDQRILQIRESKGDPDREYREKLLGFNEFGGYRNGDATIKGKILDVDEFGRLLVELACGQVVRYSHGEITFL